MNLWTKVDKQRFQSFEILATSLVSRTRSYFRMYSTEGMGCTKIDESIIGKFPLTKLAIFKEISVLKDTTERWSAKAETIADALSIHKLLMNEINQPNFQLCISTQNTRKHGSLKTLIDGKKQIMTYTWAGEERFIIDHTEVKGIIHRKSVKRNSYKTENCEGKRQKNHSACPVCEATFKKQDFQDCFSRLNKIKLTKPFRKCLWKVFFFTEKKKTNFANLNLSMNPGTILCCFFFVYFVGLLLSLFYQPKFWQSFFFSSVLKK